MTGRSDIIDVAPGPGWHVIVTPKGQWHFYEGELVVEVTPGGDVLKPTAPAAEAERLLERGLRDVHERTTDAVAHGGGAVPWEALVSARGYMDAALKALRKERA